MHMPSMPIALPPRSVHSVLRHLQRGLTFDRHEVVPYKLYAACAVLSLHHVFHRRAEDAREVIGEALVMLGLARRLRAVLRIGQI